MPDEAIPQKKAKTWARLLRARAYTTGRWMRRHQTAIFASVLIPVVCLFTAFVIFYRHYSAVIDRHTQGGLFADAANIYGEPLVITAGDPTGPAELEQKLRLAGYSHSGSGQPKTFMETPGSLVIVAEDGGSVSIATQPSRVASIQVKGKSVNDWTMGRPLVANLSAAREKRELVTFPQIPKILVDAVSSAEDKHFFTHTGIDVPRIVKAALVDLREHRKAEGASTLTMQLVRDLYLDPDKRWRRKIAEAMMTAHLEQEWSKEKIFAAYANEVYLGRQNSYSIRGFAEGAQFYFGKPLGDITLPEAATLAGIVQRPSYLNPYRNAGAAIQRRNLVLSLMRANHYITEAQYRDASAAPLQTAGPKAAADPYNTSYFMDLVTDDLDKPESEGAARSVNSTIDLDLQKAATEAIESGMAEVDRQLASRYAKGSPKPEAALIALDPHTGEIKALVGGRNYARSQLNRAFAKRPPGSVFKPIVYTAALATALEGGDQILTPASMIDDSSETFGSGSYAYTPANFRNESFGTMTFRMALAHSDNIAAVKVAEMAGYNKVVAMARRLGLNSGIKPTPSVALGSYAVTPLEIAGAYTAFANGGTRVDPHIAENSSSNAHQAIDPRLAYLMVNMMEEVMRSGTGAGVRARGFRLPAAGKTGTSHDGWFAGFTSNLLCVVWVGFDDYRDLDLEGAKSALPIWTDFMLKASKFGRYRKAVEFPQPGGIDSVRICNRSGKLAADSCTNTRSEVFIAGTEPQEKCDIDEAVVVSIGDASAPTAAATPGAGNNSPP